MANEAQSSGGVSGGSGGGGTVTSVSVVTAQGVSGTVATATTTPAITLSLGALTGVTSLNGLIVTANTGVITTGTWNGTVVTGQYGGTGVANTGFTITLAGSLVTTGAFTTTFAASATATYTLPTATSTLLAKSLGIVGGTTLIGGTATTDDLNLQATSGVGAAGSFINFKVGNNGAITAACITDTGLVGIGRDITTLANATGGYTNPMYTLDMATYYDNADGSLNPGNCTMSLKNFSGTAASPALYFSNIKLHSNRGTPTAYTMCQNGDVLGSIYFGTISTVAGTIGFMSSGAQITATAKTNWAANNQATNLQFSTCNAGVGAYHLSILAAGNSIFTIPEAGLSPAIVSGETLSVQGSLNDNVQMVCYNGTSGTQASAEIRAQSSTGKICSFLMTSAAYNVLGAGAFSADKSVLYCTGTNGTSFYNGSANPTTFYINGYGTADAKLSITSGGLVAIGTQTPTAVLHLKAGTATASTGPLKFTTGTLLTTAEAGGQEFNGSHYQTKTSALRYALGGVIYNYTTDGGNTTTGETDLYTSTTPANTLASNGELLEVEYGGVVVTSAGTATRQFKIYFAGTAIFDSGAILFTGAGSWCIYTSLIRVSSTVVRYNVSMTSLNAPLAAYTAVGELTGLTLSGTNILKITGQAGGVGAATNDIIAKSGFVKWSGPANL